MGRSERRRWGSHLGEARMQGSVWKALLLTTHYNILKQLALCLSSVFMSECLWVLCAPCQRLFNCKHWCAVGTDSVVSLVSSGLNLNHSVWFTWPLVSWPLWPFCPVTRAPAFSNPVTVNHFSFLPSPAFCPPLFSGHDALSAWNVFPLLLHIWVTLKN